MNLFISHIFHRTFCLSIFVFAGQLQVKPANLYPPNISPGWHTWKLHIMSLFKVRQLYPNSTKHWGHVFSSEKPSPNEWWNKSWPFHHLNPTQLLTKKNLFQRTHLTDVMFHDFFCKCAQFIHFPFSCQHRNLYVLVSPPKWLTHWQSFYCVMMEKRFPGSIYEVQVFQMLFYYILRESIGNQGIIKIVTTVFVKRYKMT